MIKPLYQAIGVLQTPILATADSWVVDSALQNILNTLDFDEWTYLQISNDSDVEIVQVYRKGLLGLRIARGQDYTTPKRFPVGAKISYTLTAQEILDRSISSSIILYGVEAIQVNGTLIQYIDIHIDELGASEAFVDGNIIHLARDEEAYGCCGLNNPGVPSAGEPYFYLTSELYPLEYTEKYKFDSDIIDARLKDMPFPIEFYQFDSVMLSGDLYGGGGTYNYAYEAFQFDSGMLDGDMYGSGKIYNYEYEAFQFGAYPTGGDLYGAGIEFSYEHSPEEYIFDSLLLDGTLV